MFDVGSDDGTPYVVFELLEGQTLRQRLQRGPLPARKAIECAGQVCRGLAAAHAQGILHRDLKPENLFLTKDGQVKILDFGLAKLSGPAEGSGFSEAETSTATDSHALLGTIGYMSPEQVRGERLDSRSDLFSLGVVLYEMLSGKRAFEGDTPADTLSAILNRNPEPLGSTNERLPSGVERIVRRCLEKNADERFQTARDLAFALEALRDPLAEVPLVAAAPSGRWIRGGAVALVLLGVATAGYLWGARGSARPLPIYRQLTFRRGAVLDDARFTADGNTVVYSALWDGNPPETFTTRLDTPVSRSLGLPPCRLLSISSQGELAILLGRPGQGEGDWQGTLARVSLAGGAPREVAGDVWRADWSPDGRELAVVRLVKGQTRLEYPIGHVLRSPAGAPIGLGALRVSPRGDSVALYCDEGLLVIDRAGKTTSVTVPAPIVYSFVWAPGGDALWVAAAMSGGLGGASGALWYLPLHGKPTELARIPAHLYLHDVSRDGRFLIHLGSEGVLVRAKAAGEAFERDLTVFDVSGPVAISADASQLLLWNDSEAESGAFLKPMRGGEAVKLAEERPVALSPDSRWVLNTRDDGSEFILTPVGAGESRSMRSAGLLGVEAGWFTDARHVVFDAVKPGSLERAFVLDLQAGTPAPLTPEGVLAVPGSLLGGRFIGYGPDGSLAWYPLAGGQPEPVAARVPTRTRPILASTDRRVLFLGEEGVPGHIDRLDLLTGQRIPWKTLKPEDPSGVYLVWNFRVTPDGQAYAYSYGRFLQDLYVVEGLR